MINCLNLLSLLLIPFLITFILIFGLFKKVPVYNVFVEGAKEGLFISIRILPYLIAIIVSISMFRASGAIDLIANFLSTPLKFFHIPYETLPLMVTRSLSGSATLGILSDIVSQTGADSYASKLAAIIVGSSETTFYVIAVYFGSIGIKKIRYALLCGILADIAGIVLAIFVSRYFFLI